MRPTWTSKPRGQPTADSSRRDVAIADLDAELFGTPSGGCRSRGCAVGRPRRSRRPGPRRSTANPTMDDLIFVPVERVGRVDDVPEPLVAEPSRDERRGKGREPRKERNKERKRVRKRAAASGSGGRRRSGNECGRECRRARPSRSSRCPQPLPTAPEPEMELGRVRLRSVRRRGAAGAAELPTADHAALRGRAGDFPDADPWPVPAGAATPTAAWVQLALCRRPRRAAAAGAPPARGRSPSARRRDLARGAGVAAGLGTTLVRLEQRWRRRRHRRRSR